MPKYEKHYHKNERRPEPVSKQETQLEEEEDVKWNPTPDVFNAFLQRDAELCAGNLRLVLSSRAAPMSIKEMKDSTLHSAEAVDRQVSAWLQEGLVQESKGKYSLTPVVRGK